MSLERAQRIEACSWHELTVRGTAAIPSARRSMASGARQLGLTQPAVSASIANLEAVVGERLLDRGPQGVEPTVYGKALVRRGHVVYDELTQGLQEIQQLTDPTVGRVRVACPESLSTGFLATVID